MSAILINSPESQELDKQLDTLKKKVIPSLIAFTIATLVLKYYG